jgi:hypothetical protein
LAEAADHNPAIAESYEAPTVDDELLAALRTALASVPDLHEAYLVNRCRSMGGVASDEGLGVVARAGGRWHSREQLAALSEALKPFYPPPFDTPLRWGNLGKLPVPEQAKAVGIWLGGRH